jgi:hypothetical protein
MAERGAQLEVGAVALLDALGFKGIWNQYPPEDVVHSILNTRARAKRNAELYRRIDDLPIEAHAFSDTLVVTVQGFPDANIALMSLALHVAFAQGIAAVMPVPLLYRGCVTAGPLLANDGVFIGRAIDEASELYEAAAAGVVWLAPSAVKAWNEPGNEELVLMEWDVPFRDGGSLTTLVVNPFTSQTDLDHDLDVERLDRLEVKLLATFDRSSRLDVAQKRQRTAAFLKAAKGHTIKVFPNWRESPIAATSGDGNG